MSAFGRRGLLAGAGGLVLSFALAPAKGAEAPLPGSLKETPALDAWIRVAPTGQVTVFTGKAELGQGLRTALTQIAAEQLDLAIGQVTLVTADTGLTANEGITAGSHSMQDSGTAILHAAAQTRGLLVAQAAAQLGVPAEQLRVANGVVAAPDGRRLDYGALAATLDLHVSAQPESPLNPPESYRIIGTPVPRLDIPPKVTGGAAFIQDMRLPGMLHARVVRQPSAGALLQDCDMAVVGAMPGVVKVVRLASFVAVVAKGEWQAVKAWRVLAASCRWQETAQLPDAAEIAETLRALPSREIEVLRWTNDAAAPARRLSARYTRPYQMHGAIGPSCALALAGDAGLTVWTHTQGVYPQRGALAELLRMPPEKIRCIHVQGSGCYGHNGADDVAADAALVAREMPGHAIRVQWMREDENTSEPFGCAMVSEASAALAADGAIVDWTYDVWSNTHNRRPNKGGLFLANAALPEPLPKPPPAPIPMPEGGGDRNSNPLYALPNAHVVYHFVTEEPLRNSAMRALGAYLNIFAIESFFDELAEAAGADPIEFRLRHMQDARARDVIQAAAKKFGWAESRPGTGRGFAFARYKNLGAYCAIALSLSVEHETGRVRIGRVVAAVDSGQPINPDGIRAQVEGAIVQSASWTLYEQVAYDRQHITSRDWSFYPILRFPAVPESIEVVIADRPGAPYLGTGEAGQGPMAAAIANAIRDATGRRLRDLPLSADKIKAAIGV